MSQILGHSGIFRAIFMSRIRKSALKEEYWIALTVGKNSHAGN
jgi:hypothetical protein